MRAELRKKIPKTRGCGAAIILAIIVVVVGGGVLLWNWVQNTPARMVQKAVAAAKQSGETGLRPFMTPESLTNPSSEAWLKELAQAFKCTTMLKKEEVVGDEGTVHVLIIQRAVGNLAPQTDLGVRAVRSKGKDWLIELDATMASVGPQFWLSLANSPP